MANNATKCRIYDTGGGNSKRHDKPMNNPEDITIGSLESPEWRRELQKKLWRRASVKPMPLPLVTECKHGHCSMHFPQFSKLTHIDFRDRLVRAANRMDREGQANVNQKDMDDLKKFRDAIVLLNLFTHEGFMQACELAGEAYGYELYESLRGDVLVFQPCCK